MLLGAQITNVGVSLEVSLAAWVMENKKDNEESSVPKSRNQFTTPTPSYVPPPATGHFDGGLSLQRRWINRRDDLKVKMEQCLALGSGPRAGAIEYWRAQSLTDEPVCSLSISDYQ